MHITGAERGFLLLADSSPRRLALPDRGRPAPARRARPRRRQGPVNGHGISGPIVRRALETGEVISTVRTAARWSRSPAPGPARRATPHPVQTIVCLPLRSPRAGADGAGGFPRALGVLYVDNAGSAEPFSDDALRAAEALARHAALAIENAQLFEREQHTIEELQQGPEAAAAVGEARHHRPDGGRHRPRAQHPAHLHHGQPGAARAAGADARPSARCSPRSPAGRERIRTLAQRLLAFSRPAREEMAPARRQRRGRAQPGAVPVPDRERRACRSSSALDAGPAARPRASRTSSRWRSSTWS